MSSDEEDLATTKPRRPYWEEDAERASLGGTMSSTSSAVSRASSGASGAAAPPPPPDIKMREKSPTKATTTAASGRNTWGVNSGGGGSPFARLGSERHSVSDFSERRSPKGGKEGGGTMGRLELWASKRLGKKKQRTKVVEEESAEESEFARQVNAMNTEQLVKAVIPVLKEMNIAANNTLQKTLDSFDDRKMRQLLITNEARMTSDKKKKTVETFLHELEHEFSSMAAPQQRKTLQSLRVALGGETVQWVGEFVQPNGREGGMKLLSMVMATTLNTLSKKSDCDPECRDYIGVLTEAVRSARAIVNTYPGLEMILRREMNLHLRIIQVLALLTTRTFKQPDTDEDTGYGRVGGALQTAGVADEMAEARALRADIVKLVSGIAMVNKKMTENLKIEMTGAQRLLEDLSAVGRKLGKTRFRPVIHAYARSKTDYESLYRLTAMVNMIVESQDDMDLTDEQAWQARVHIRNELMRDGLATHVEYMSKLVTSTKRQEESPENQHKIQMIEDALEAFIALKDEDFKDLIGRFENLKGEYETLDGCFEILRSTTVSTPVENPLLSIFQHLMMVTDDVNTRSAYFRLIENCVSEIVLHRSGVDPDFNSRFHFETNVADMIETLENSEASKRLESAVQAKHEAAALSMTYWAKLKEFEDETKKLRQHISDPKTPLPPSTACNLKPPSTDGTETPSTSGLPPVTGGPPPPPPPGGLPPVTGGPPPPPPPPGGLPPVTGGPPPPPPPPGGPPPPPGCGPPPPPPPPPPGGLRGPPGAPPPPPGMVMRPQEPPLPDFLKKKTKREVKIPMRKNYWTTIKPQQLEKDSLWARLNEEKLANEKRLEELRTKFSSSKAPVGVEIGKDSAGRAAEASKKKQKMPVVLQDGKVIQALAILQGSAKISHSAWKKGLLELDDKLLTAGLLQQLRAALPALDVLKKLADAAKTKFDEMPEGEQFAASVASISALPLRLDLMIFKARFSEILDEIKPGLSSVTEACDDFMKSKGLKTFLEFVLLCGNYMHSSVKTFEVAYAFELSALPKVADTKDNENHQTLLHHIVQQMRTDFPEQARFVQTDMHHVPAAARVNPDETAKAVAALKSSITKLENALKTYTRQGEADRFVEVMTPFLERASQECMVVETLHKKMLDSWSRLHKYFAVDAKKYGMEQFFSDMKTFKEQYENVCRELDEEKAKAAKEKEMREKKKREPLKPTQSSATRNALGGRITPGNAALLTTAVDSPGVLDELDKLMSGGAFARPPGRTARAMGGPRTKAGRAALQRQRSRCPGDSISSIGTLIDDGGTDLTGSTTTVSTLNQDETMMQPQQGSIGKMRLRKKGQPTVEISNGHQENAVPKPPRTGLASAAATAAAANNGSSPRLAGAAPTALAAVMAGGVGGSPLRPTPNRHDSNTIPTTDDLLQRLQAL